MGGAEGEEGGPRASDLRPVLVHPQHPPPLPHSTPPHPRQAGQGPQRPELRRALRALHTGIKSTTYPARPGSTMHTPRIPQMHSSHSLQVHTPPTPPSSHTHSLQSPYSLPTTGLCTTAQSPMLPTPLDPSPPSPITRSYLGAGPPSFAALLAVLRALLTQARGLGDTSLRYEELGGGWVPGPEAAPAPPQKPTPSSSARQGSRCGPQAGS